MAGSGTSKKILIVEDDRAIAEMYAHSLTRAGYAVEFAFDGDSGLAKTKQTAYDLILLDIMMPGLSGIEVLGQLREEGGTGLPNTKIVVLTNLAQDKQSKEALAGQADGYLIKADVVPSKLVEIINRLLGAAKS